VAFSELRSPLAYSVLRPSILNALPERYAPFNKNTGRSNLGYFALPDDAGQVLVDEIEKREPLFLERAVTTEYADKDDAPTTRDALVAARMGQGKFRADLETIWNGGCALCTLTRRELLRASHIKPWSASNNAERLDPYNGRGEQRS
jgi:putative restriction endonuclease